MVIMKTNSIFKKLALAFCALAMFATQSYAQWDSQKAHLIVDWQMNAPVSTDFADKISGWGMNFEGLYELTPRWSVGAFINFHTNHKYIGRQTLQLSPTEALTTDQQRSAYQLPFFPVWLLLLLHRYLPVRLLLLPHHIFPILLFLFHNS